MAITVKERELAAVGISIATGCKPCTDYHLKAVRKARARDEEIMQAVADALAVREAATAIMQAYVSAQMVETEHESGAASTDKPNRMRTLVSVGAAYGVNCVSSLQQHLSAAEAMRISQDEISEIVKLATMIKGRAGSHMERLVGLTEEEAA